MVLRVLLVDDDEALTAVAKVFLERGKDIEVEASPSAKDALEKLKSDNYDVIVADYQMPEMNGLELLRKLKSEDNATPFILFTGRGREDVAIDALNSGASFYLQKGGDPKSEFAELVNMIKRSARHAQVEKAHAELMVDLQRSHKLLSATLESTTDGILGFDRDGNVLVYNNRFMEIWGIPEQDIKSRNWDQMMHSILDQLKDPDRFKNTVYNGFKELNLQNRSIIEFKDGRVFDYVSNPMYVNDEAVGRIANFRDITNQVRAEGTLRQEKDKAQQYLSLAGVMLLALDKHGKVTLVNKRGCEILGYDEKQIIGKSWFENFLSEGLRDEIRTVFKGLMQGNLGPLEFQPPIPVLCGGGVERYIAFTNALLKNERGEVIGTLSSGEDVTERKKAEDALRVSLAKYTTLFESLPLGVTIADKGGNITESNKEAERLLGLSREDQVKRQIDGREWRIVRPDGSPMPASEYASVRAMKENRRVSDVEMGILKGDGHATWINVNAAPIPLAGYGVAITYTDVTERKRMADALRESKERYHKLVEGMLDGVAYCQMLYDDLGHPVDWIYLNVNSNFEKLTGLRDITGKRVTEAIPGIEKADPILFEIYGRVASKGQPENFEMEIKSLGQWLRVSVFCPEKDHFVAVFDDITKRKQTENALREGESSYRQLANGITDMFLALDKDLRCTYWNKTCEELTGISARDAIGKPLTELTPGPQGERAKEAYLEVMRTGKARTFFSEFSIGGKKHAVESTAYPFENGLSVITKDITERKRAEEALQKSEAKFAIAFNSSPEMMVIGSLKDGRLIDVNNSFLRATGHSREEVLGRTITEIGMVTEAERDRVRSVVEEKGSVQGLEIHDRTKSGADRITVLSAAAISIEGEPCMLVIISDVTERRRAEQAASEAEIRFQSFMNHLPAVCYMVDTSDRYVYINKVFEELLGMSADDIVGKNVREVWPPTTAESLAKTHQNVFSSQKPLELVETVPMKDGGREFLSLKFPVPALSGNPKVLGGISLDITEQRHLEGALRQANKKLALLGSVTRHDAINQLSVLMAWLDIAMEVGRDLPTMEQLTKAQESAILLQNQLEFTAQYQEIGVKQPQWIDLRVSAFAGVEGLDLGAVSLKVDLRGIEIYADPMLEKVFHNLVDNSLRYGEKLTQIRLYIEEFGGRLMIVCEDDGVGVPVGEKEKIFIRGYGRHTGLGLYLVREILELTGIEIRETGEAGKGARFELLVPVGDHRIGRVG